VVLKLIAFVLPLGFDSLALALGLGASGLPANQRLRVSLVFAGFEAAMPLIGAALGVPLGTAIGRLAGYVAAGLVLLLGSYLLLVGDRDADKRERLLSVSQSGLLGAAALGLSIGLDELAIGFSAGLLELPILALVAAVCLQAFVFTQLGVTVGAYAGIRAPEVAERLGGLTLVALGIVLMAERVAN
jgi:putative Mn2+ efflux pump MntP